MENDEYHLDSDVQPILPADRNVHILALSGGGYRGLFTARILELLESEYEEPLSNRFDLITGTSIGAIIAGAISIGIPAKKIRETMIEHGELIFPTRNRLSQLYTTVKSLYRTPYSAEPIEQVIDSILGDHANLLLSDHNTSALMIPCVDHTHATGRWFRSAALAAYKDHTEHVTLKQAMLASAAAPTYFPPQVLSTSTMIDGGLVANAPDSAALCEAVSYLGSSIEHVYTLSIGTASRSEAKPPIDHGRVGMIRLARPLFTTVMSAQEALAISQCRVLQTPSRYLRIDRKPSERENRAIGLDKAGKAASDTLMSLADACYRDTKAGSGQQLLTRFMQHTKTMT